MGIKICTIGGGSSYTPELIDGFIKRYDKLPVSEIWLVDCEEGKEKLEIVGNLARRMVLNAGLDIKINLTLDRKEALTNADFVTTQIRVGGLSARIKDEGISQEFGILGQETNGPAGMFKALRTIPIILDICKDIEKYCPNAWLINFTNPAGIVTEAVLRYSNIKKVIGLCNVPINMERSIAKIYNVANDKVRINFAGLNHFVYGLSINVCGENVTEEALEKFANEEVQPTMKNIDPMNWDVKFVKTLGVMPSPYHKYFYMHKEMLEKALAKTEVRGETVKKVEEDLFKIYSDQNVNTKPKELEQRGGAYYSDAACNLICSIYNDTCDIQTVDTRNNGAIFGIDDNSAVEVSSVITKDGPKPIAVGKLPYAINGMVMQIKSFEMLVCECAVNGDRDKGILALASNPFVQDIKKAELVFNKLLEAHKDYLPQF